METRQASLRLVLLLGLSSCSLVYSDTIDKKQCSTSKNCETYGASLVCQEGLCVTPSAGSDAGTQRVACTEDSQCTSEQRCGYDGFCYEKWGCLARDFDWPKPQSVFHYRQLVRRFEAPMDLKAVGDLLPVVCSVVDPTCARPAVTTQEIIISADRELDIPFTGISGTGFTGFLRVDPKAATTGSDAGPANDAGRAAPALPAPMPSYIHFTAKNPLVANLVGQNNLLMIAPSSFALLAELAEVMADNSAGTVVLRAYDCGGRSAAGVSMSPNGFSGYTFVPIQDESIPLFGSTATSSDGLAALINIPERNHVFVIRDEESGRTLTDEVTFIVRAGALNFFFYYPRYSAIKLWMAQEQQIN